MAIACFRLVTRPPLPPFPERNVPRFSLCIALFTDLAAAFPYLAMIPPLPSVFRRWFVELTAAPDTERCVDACKISTE